MMMNVLKGGIRNVSDGRRQFGLLNGGQVQRIKHYIEQVEMVVNNRILGTVWNPSKWRTDYDFKEMSLPPLNMVNYRTRKVMNLDITRHTG